MSTVNLLVQYWRKMNDQLTNLIGWSPSPKRAIETVHFEPVFSYDWYDGPISGVANYNGSPYFFEYNGVDMRSS